MFEDIEERLPVKIARIEVQKKNKMRYSLYSEDGFIAGISEAVLIGLNIRKGTILTQNLLAKMTEVEERNRVNEYLLSLLSRRDHAGFELAQKAAKKGFDKAVTAQLIDELRGKGYVNDREFAFKYTADKFNLNRWGSNKIKMELRLKKIAEKDINDAVNNYFRGELAAEAMIELTLKRKPALLRSTPESRKKKLFDYLMRKGYHTNIILKEIDTLLELIRE